MLKYILFVVIMWCCSVSYGGCLKSISQYLSYMNHVRPGHEMGLVFSCDNSDDDKPVLRIVSPRSRVQLVKVSSQVHDAIYEQAFNWQLITGSSFVDICDSNGVVVFKLVEDGDSLRFFVVEEFI